MPQAGVQALERQTDLESVVNKKDQSSDYYFISMNTLIKQTIV